LAAHDGRARLPAVARLGLLRLVQEVVHGGEELGAAGVSGVPAEGVVAPERVRGVGGGPAEAAEPPVPPVPDPGGGQPLLQRLAPGVGVAAAAGHGADVHDAPHPRVPEQGRQLAAPGDAVTEGDQRLHTVLLPRITGRNGRPPVTPGSRGRPPPVPLLDGHVPGGPMRGGHLAEDDADAGAGRADGGHGRVGQPADQRAQLLRRPALDQGHLDQRHQRPPGAAPCPAGRVRVPASAAAASSAETTSANTVPIRRRLFRCRSSTYPATASRGTTARRSRKKAERTVDSTQKSVRTPVTTTVSTPRSRSRPSSPVRWKASKRVLTISWSPGARSRPATSSLPHVPGRRPSSRRNGLRSASRPTSASAAHSIRTQTTGRPAERAAAASPLMF